MVTGFTASNYEARRGLLCRKTMPSAFMGSLRSWSVSSTREMIHCQKYWHSQAGGICRGPTQHGEKTDRMISNGSMETREIRKRVGWQRRSPCKAVIRWVYEWNNMPPQGELLLIMGVAVDDGGS